MGRFKRTPVPCAGPLAARVSETRQLSMVCRLDLVGARAAHGLLASPFGNLYWAQFCRFDAVSRV